ncbi:MAG TPA: alpha/beta hydrolase [Firmicutes bacterium]|nr:alpha/beta hydrolase [Bacillota bacterium]
MQRILLHGLGQAASSWQPTVERLAEPADVYCPALFDWLSGGPAGYDALYAGFSAYCRSFQSPLALCGLSLGGLLALQYAIEHPQQIHSLVLAGVPFHMPKRLLQFQNWMFRLMPQSAFQKAGLSKQDTIRLCASMAQLDLTPGLSALKCPVLLLCGEKDRANKGAALQFQKRLPQAKFVLIPRARHEVNVDAPDALAKELNDFWAQ